MNIQPAASSGDNQRRGELAACDHEDGMPASGRRLEADTERQQSDARDERRSALDTSHQSSVRGEHRYPDLHQTDAEQQARGARDALKRKLGGDTP